MPDAEVNETGLVVEPPILGGASGAAIAAGVSGALGGVAPVRVDRARTKKLGVLGWCAIGWLGIVALMAIVPTFFPVPSLHTRSVDALLSDHYGPSLAHPLGLDTSGYDMMTKVVYGARASMIISVIAVLSALIVGGFLGLVAGYFRGWLDTVISMMFNVQLSMPALVLALAAVTVFASGDSVSYARRVLVVTAAIGYVSIPGLGRITRANTLAWSEREFVMAARLLGAKTPRIIRREVLPNVMPAMFSLMLLGVGIAIVAEGGLSLLGVGVPAGIDTPSWGNLISSLRSQLFLGKPWGVFAPSLAIFLTVLSLNYLGDVVRARFDVRESVL